MSNRFHRRVVVLSLLFCAILGGFGALLYRLQVVHGAEYRAQSVVTVLSTETIKTARGNILDRNGELLITNEVSYDLVLSPTELGKNCNDEINRLLALCRQEGVVWANTLPISDHAPWAYTRADVFLSGDSPTRLGSLALRLNWIDDLNETPPAADLLSAMGKTFGCGEDRALIGVLYELALRTYQLNYNDYVFARGLSMPFLTKLNEGDFPGAAVRTTLSRLDVGHCASHVLGRVGQLNAEEWPTYRTMGYAMDAYVGKDGIELAFEAVLHGTSGVRRTQRDTEGVILDQEWLGEPRPGSHVVLTLDREIQTVTETLLEQFVTALDEPAGAAAVMVDMTGGVLALASYPDYDLSTYHRDYAALSTDPARPLFNRATQGLYAPGSTFKPLVAVAALSEGIIDRNSVVDCTGVYTYYDDVHPRCWIASRGGYHGGETVTDAITDSCNIFFYDVGRRVGITTLNRYAADFGLGQPTGIEVPEKVGRAAGPATSTALGQTWYGGNTMYAAIGQENNQFTPLQLANYIATLVNGGNHYQAHLLQEVRGEEAQTVEPFLLNTVSISPTTLNAVKQGMYDLSKTTSIAPYFDALPVEVGCKTGTAEVLGTTSNAIFVCFAPYENPQVALCVVAEKGASGGSLASIAAGMLAVLYPTAEITLSP